VVGSGGLDGGGEMSGGSGLGGFGGPMAASAFGGAMASAFDSASFASQMTSAAYGAPMTLPPQFSGQMPAPPFGGQMQAPPQFGGQMQPQAYTPPTFAAPTSAPAPAPMAEIAARASAQQGSAFAPDTLSTQPLPSESGASHVCTWPGCGKGFSSRWSLERHVKNHQSVPPGEQEQPDSFVERRLRERVKSVQQALEKTREKLAQHAKQQEQADAELREARLQGEQQQAEMERLMKENTRMASQLPPAVVQQLLAPLAAAAGGTSILGTLDLPQLVLGADATLPDSMPAEPGRSGPGITWQPSGAVA